MQKIENCLSGYYAAFGSYPPVKLHGSRNYRLRVNKYGIQQVNEDPDNGELVWDRVNAACRSQPVAMNYPYTSDMSEYVNKVSEALTELHNNSDPDSPYAKNKALAYGFDALAQPSNLGAEKQKSSSWSDTQIFRFGLMSYLLPRYLIMMQHSDTSIYDKFFQWGDNNELPCRFEDGTQYENWQELAEDISRDNEKWKIALMPSQAVTARWLPNLEGAIDCQMDLDLYGIKVGSGSMSDVNVRNPNPPLHSGEDSQSGENAGHSQKQYVLDGITIMDGWSNELYYYSKPPYQAYRLWSAGANGKTFPPWVPEEELNDFSAAEKKKILNWISDDIVHMTN